ncbi:amino acid adenylation domain-containing protein [Kitasatospora sp. NPDC089913]|uniref:amino acid adenylation domain-containing protein n=1 Tax=Kitasatospora sp. NPDC089913 TaxID=3364080 RepID=UPI003824D3A8
MTESDWETGAADAIAVVGMACRVPGADSPEEFWELLRDGIDPTETVPSEQWPAEDRWVGVRKRFADPALFDAEYFGMTPAEAALTDPQQRFLLEAAVHALDDAALPAARRGRTGVFVALNHSDYLLRHVLAHPEVVDRHGWHRVLMGSDRGFTATRIAYRLGLTGPALAVDCGCSGSLAAVHLACRALLDYEADTMLAGGAAVRPEDHGYQYTEGGIVSPDGRCRPFSDRAEGTVFASGVGLVVLRRLDDALADGDRVLAVIRASGINNDGDRKSGYTAPSVEGQAELIAGVHRDAGVSADRIGYLEAHGTATALGDPIEVAALTEAFRASTGAVGGCALGAVKSAIGHLDSAAGVAGLIAAVLALRHRTLPGVRGFERPNPHLDLATTPFEIGAGSRPWPGGAPRLAGVSSFGVGGTNVHVLVEEAPEGARGGPGGPLTPFDRKRHWLPSTPPPRPLQEEPGTGAAAPDWAEVALDLFAEALGTGRPEPDDDLFVLGGDSLTAQQLVAGAESRWQVELPFGTFLGDPTPERLAELLAGAGPAQSGVGSGAVRSGVGAGSAQPGVGSGPAAEQRVLLPVSALQERFLYLAELPGAATAYHVPVLAELRGPLDPALLEQALGDLVRRHEALRLRYHQSGGRPECEVVDPGPVPLPVVELADERELERAVTDLLVQPLPLDRPPALRAALLRLGERRHVLALSVHHICADARSTGILLADLYRLLARRSGRTHAELPDLTGRLADVLRAGADFLDSPAADRQLAYWRTELADAPGAPELPGDRPRAAERRFRGAQLEFTLTPEQTALIRSTAQRARVTPFTVVLAAFGTLLGGLSGSTDLVIGVPVSGRHRPQTAELVGNFVNTLPVRTVLDPARGFDALLADTARRLAGAFDHQDLPFEVLAQRLGRPGEDLVGVLFNLLDGQAESEPLPDLDLTAHPVPFDRPSSPYELSLDWWFRPDGTLGGRFLYDTDRFDPATVRGWQRAFARLLERLTTEPQRPLAEQDPAGGDTAAALTGPVVTVPDRAVHEVVADWAERDPDRLALADADEHLTYRRLDELSAAIAHLLADHGVRPGDRVGLALPRDARSVAAVLGVLRAGAAAVPLDLTLPTARLALMAEDCAPAVVLHDGPVPPAFATALRTVELPPVKALPAGPRPFAAVPVPGSATAYLTYTSGTTGRPKGIVFPHRALANLIHWETGGHTRALRWLQFASLGFDAAFHEIFAALCAGGSLHVADEETRHDHELLADFVAEHRVEKAILPVSLLHSLAAVFHDRPERFAGLREIATTGEQLRLTDRTVAFLTALPDCALVNNYGPAETHVVTSYRFTGPSTRWPRHAPIGRPIQNVRLSLGRPGGLPVVPGAVGRLDIAGPCTADGYLGLPELTAERFPRLAGRPGYRSGDRVRLLPSGDLEFLGRDDQQLKIRGHRVEPAEIDLALRRVPGVQDVALAVRGEAGERRIDAYLVAAGPADDLAARARAVLTAELPAAFVPATFTLLDALPVNANGKVDTARLPAPGSRAPGAAPVAGSRAPAAVPGSTPAAAPDVPEAVLDAFRTALEQPGLGPDEDFFAAGGHSLLAARLVHALRHRLAGALTVAELYRHPSPRAVARLLAGRPSARADDAADDTDVEPLPVAALPAVLPPGLRETAATTSPRAQKTFVLELAEEVDLPRLTAAVHLLTHRHSALRLTTDGPTGRPRLRPAEEPASPVRALRLPERPTPADPAEWLRATARQDLIDPGTGPLWRLHTAGRLIALTVHLAALDGLGLQVLERDLLAAYHRPEPLDPAARPDPGYPRYLAWRGALVGTPRAAEAAAAWRRLQNGLPSGPAGEPARPAAEPVPVGRAGWTPGPELRAALLARAAEHATSPFALHLAALATALSRTEQRPGGCVSVPLDGRVHPELGESVGAFANVVPLPVPVAADRPPHVLLDRLKPVLAELERLRAVPYTDLAAADPELAAPGLPQVRFGYAWDDGREPEGARWIESPHPEPTHRLDLAVRDGVAGFSTTVLAADGPEAAERLLTAYRQALYALLFEAPAEPVETLVATPSPATSQHRSTR